MQPNSIFFEDIAIVFLAAVAGAYSPGLLGNHSSSVTFWVESQLVPLPQGQRSRNLTPSSCSQTLASFF